MPTDTLPPLADVPEQALTPADTAHAAGWAQTFGGSDTSLAQRYRHNADIQRHTKAVQDAQAAHVQDSLAHDKGAQDLYFRQKTLDATIDNREASLAQRQAQFDATLAAKQKMDEITGQLKIAQTEAAGARAVASANANKAKALLAAHEATDTDAAAGELTDALSKGTVKSGTPAYAEFILNLRGKHPAMGKNFATDLWKAANTNLSEDEYKAKLDQKAATLAGTQARTLGTEARTEATAANVDIAKSREARMQSQFDRKLSDADTSKEDTSAFLADAARLHEKVEQGTPEYRNGMADLVAAYPTANPAKIKAFMGLAGIADTDAQSLRVRAQDFREKMALRNADRQDKALTTKDTLNANELALRGRGQSLRETQAVSRADITDAASINKEIARIEKESPEWMGTTGVMPDEKGVERFGFSPSKQNQKRFNESLVATPELKAQYQHYQNLLARRAAKESGGKTWIRANGELKQAE